MLMLAVALVAAVEGQVIRVGIGSCAHQDSTQAVWDAVAEWKPDLFVHLGDAVYADTQDSLAMRSTYLKGFGNPKFKSVRKQIPFLATWDDHDYGANDAGASYPMRRASQALFLEFWEEPESSERRLRDGLYGSQVIEKNGHLVRVILLDTRFFRSDWSKDSLPGRRYEQDRDPQKTMLGDVQWAWLERELRQPADLRLIASSIQVINDEHGWEGWGNFPLERERILDLVQAGPRIATVFVSGDRHFSELSRVSAAGRPLYDLTASGLTQVAVNGHKVPNTRRVGNPVSVQNFAGVTVDFESGTITFEGITAAGDVAFDHIVPVHELIDGSK
jgi:alkaline phosphatase D